MSGLEPGSRLGAYKILARLRAGAMGVLYLARREGPGGFARPVAIKVIHDHLAANGRFTRMFIDEARLSAKIDDPNVVRVEEFGEIEGRHYIVMEYVHGASLAQVIGLLRDHGGVPMAHAVAIAMQMCAGLHGAHEATDDDGTPLGIVHRDVSPHNVLVSYKGAVRIIDFGVAKARQVGGQTKTGSLRGKLAYMPPEQARSARTVDRRADLYCVGLVLWEMLTGRRLFDADSDIAILNQIRSPVIVPPSELAPAVPRALDDVVARTLSQDPAGRPESGAALQRQLGEALPAALGILNADLAALMGKVRAIATAPVARPARAEGAEAAREYGEELRRSLTAFGESVGDEERTLDEGPPAGAAGDATSATAITRPNASDATVQLAEPPVKAPRSASGGTLVLEGAPLSAGGRTAVTPVPMARPSVPPPPSSGSLYVPTPVPPPPPLAPPSIWTFANLREPLLLLVAAITTILALIGIVLDATRTRAAPPPVSARVAPSAATSASAGRAMPPPPTIIAPPEPATLAPEPESSAAPSAARPSHAKAR